MAHSSLILCISILSSSLIGSWHCAGMCGPIATFVAHKGQMFGYHVGRGIGYISLGVLAGSIGRFFLTSDFYWLRIASGAILSVTILLMGCRMIFFGKNISITLPVFFQRFMTMKSSSFVIGLFSMFLPCGWLYTYVVAAAASQSPYSGALVMLLFWLGTIPALSVFPSIINKTIALSNKRKQKIAGGILVFASLYAVTSFYFLHSL